MIRRYRRWPNYQAARRKDARHDPVLLRAYQDAVRDELFAQMKAGELGPTDVVLGLTALAWMKP